jgi:uncharacterized repeat protein (TIGR03847 family)
MTEDVGTVVLVSGAVGDPGQRTFYLQTQSRDGVHTIKCEKGQVAALAEHLERLLADLPSTGATALVPTDLLPPLDPLFVLGTIGLAYDGDSDHVVVVLEELVVPDEDAEDVDEVLDAELEHDGIRLEMTRGVASAFCARAKEIVAAGRPSCRWCGRPMDLDGHACPRMN